ncbi:MAG TPA: hypothetical protein VFH53_04050, partial [Phycisphaerae bacterium]|nr:hypothetical protein [Phycisphaerae bacterium]
MAAKRVATPLVLALFACPLLGAVAPPEHVDITLRNVLWQTLPDEVRAVYVGPDERIWYELRYEAWPIDWAHLRGVIEREFRKEAPQVLGVRPVLFESNGRVWFSDIYSMLLGYDGHTWIEHAAEKKHYFEDILPNHGRREGETPAVELAGTLFFPDNRGVHCFDGKTWTYKEFLGPRPGGRDPIVLVPQADGRTLLVTGPQEVLWRWKAGEWTELDRKALLGDIGTTRLVPWGKEGFWVGSGQDSMFFWELGVDPAAQFASILARLGDERFAVREEATAALIQMGARILLMAEKARAETDDPEIRLRLDKVIVDLRHPEQAFVPLGPYLVKAPRLLPCDDPGVMYVGSEEIQEGGKSVGPGVVVAEVAGRYRLLEGPEFLQAWHHLYSGVFWPVVLKPSRLVWLAGDYVRRPACLLDVEKGQFVAVPPEKQIGWLHAVRSDGTVFLSRSDPVQGGGVYVFKPGAPEDRQFLSGQTFSLGRERDNAVVARDGAVWAGLEDQGFSRFDGKVWQPVKALAGKKSVLWVDFGRNGEVLLKTDTGYELLDAKGDSVGADEDLAALVVRCRARITAVFAHRHGVELTGIGVDKGGNIWLVERRRLRVLVGERWLEANQALCDAGMRSEEVEYLTLLGDGSRVYVTDLGMVHDGGRSFFGEVQEGRLVFVPAPHTSERVLSVVDHEGAFWLPGSVTISMGTSDKTTAQLAQRLTEKGTVQEIKNAGWAYLCDKAGNVWLGHIGGGPRNQFNIWRNGKIEATVSIPASGNYFNGPISDRLGSVYVWTESGLYHLMADSAAPAKYAVKTVWHPCGIEGKITGFAYSDLGYFVFLSTVERDDNNIMDIRYFVTLIP